MIYNKEQIEKIKSTVTGNKSLTQSTIEIILNLIDTIESKELDNEL